MLEKDIRSVNSSNNTDNLDIKYEIKSITLQEYNETIEFKKIKELLCEDYLEYVTEYLRTLLKINKPNNPNCFKKTLYNDSFFREQKKAIIYLRLSQEDITKTEDNVSKSILNQLLMLLTYCTENNLRIVGIFYEEDISGSDESRPEWNKSLLFCELGNTNIYLCKTQARFARDVEMIEKYLHKKFIEWDIRFLSIVDHSDTADRRNKLQRQITAVVDENKLAEQSINTKSTLRTKNNAGQWTGSFAPFGYIEDPFDMYHFIIDEPVAKIVREIYEMSAKGDGYRKICKTLNEKKIPTPSKYKKLQGSNYVCPVAPNGSEFWSVDTIRKILMDETYDGVLIQHRTESISYNIKKRKKIPKNEQIITACSHDRIVDPNISKIVRKKFKDKKSQKLLKEARTTSNTLINAIESIKEECKNVNKDILANIELHISTLKSALLSDDIELIVQKYNELRELTVTLNSQIYSKIQDKVQTISTSTTRAKPDKNGEVHIFSQKIYCKCCGKVFQKNKFKTGPRNSEEKKYKEYLLCRTRTRVGIEACDNINSIRYEKLESIVLEEINKMLKCYYDKSKLEKNYYEKKAHNDYDKDINILLKEKNSILKQIKINEDKFAMLYNDKTAGIITLEEFIILKNKIKEENENSNLRITKIVNEIAELELKKEQNVNEYEIFDKYSHIEKLDRLIVDTFISKIIIGKVDPKTKKRDMKIIWNIAL